MADMAKSFASYCIDAFSRKSDHNQNMKFSAGNEVNTKDTDIGMNQYLSDPLSNPYEISAAMLNYYATVAWTQSIGEFKDSYAQVLCVDSCALFGILFVRY